jgi:hypothetical protein
MNISSYDEEMDVLSPSSLSSSSQIQNRDQTNNQNITSQNQLLEDSDKSTSFVDDTNPLSTRSSTRRNQNQQRRITTTETKNNTNRNNNNVNNQQLILEDESSFSERVSQFVPSISRSKREETFIGFQDPRNFGSNNRLRVAVCVVHSFTSLNVSFSSHLLHTSIASFLLI